MGDYAIGAVGQASGNDRLLDSGPVNEVLRFEQIGSREDNSIWDINLTSSGRIRIIQEASSSDAPQKTAPAPWDDLGGRMVKKLDDLQDDVNNSLKAVFDKDRFNLDMPRMENPSPMAFMKHLLKDFQSASWDMLKVQRALGASQLKITLVGSISDALKGAITTLYRQQG